MDLMMLVFILIFLIIILYKVRIGKSVNNSFFEKEQSKVIKGICCIVVFLVHVPKMHGNVVQDAIGSFGYICVTIFFLFSAYGLKYSISNKKNYLNHFIRNRILIIYIPFLIANTLRQLINWKGGFDVLYVIGINNISFIGELILFYILFYVIYKKLKGKTADNIMIGLTLIISIVTYIFRLGWFVECLGFAYGILLYNNEMKIKRFLEKNYSFKCLFGLISSLLLGVLYLKFKNIVLISYIVKILLGVSIISFIICLFRKIKIYNKILLFLGKISFEIYLLHDMIMTKFIWLNVSSGIYIVITLIVTIIAATLMNYIDSKIAKYVKFKQR